MTASMSQQLGTSALKRADAGERLSHDEISALYELPAAEVVAVAHAARLRKTDPELATFSIGGNINYTTVCNIACKFCTFYRTPRQQGAYTLTPEQVLDQLSLQVRLGITEVMIEGGINPELPYEWYLEVLRLLKQAHPDIHIDFLSPEEVHGLEKLTGRDAKDILAELQEAGMDGLPGASAEILCDEVRRRVAPARIKTADWFRIVDDAMELGIYIPWTSLVFGLGETIEQRVDHLIALRDQQDRDIARGGAGFGAYKVWPMRLDDTRLSGVIESPGDDATVELYLQQVAIHRLALDNIDNHRCVWRTMGFGTAGRALRGGANDICGTGSINAVDSVLETAGKQVPDPADSKIHRDLLDCIRRTGFTPARRDARYKVIAVHPVSAGPPKSLAVH